MERHGTADEGRGQPSFDVDDDDDAQKITREQIYNVYK